LATNTQASPFATTARRSPSRSTVALAAAAPAAYALGALMLAGKAAVHIQQYVAIFHEVNWVGPLFLANAAACLLAVVGLVYRRTRRVAALAGVVISVVALGSLVVSYGQGLFGWHEGGFRTPVALVTIAEVAAVLLLSAPVAASLTDRRSG
jgi:hypothetical protein